MKFGTFREKLCEIECKGASLGNCRVSRVVGDRSRVEIQKLRSRFESRGRKSRSRVKSRGSKMEVEGQKSMSWVENTRNSSSKVDSANFHQLCNRLCN